MVRPSKNRRHTGPERRLQFMYVHDNAMGYGRMGTQLHAGFQKHGVTVLDGPVFDNYNENGTKPSKVILWASLPNNALGWYENQYRAVFTMWEATRVPENLQDGLHNIDMLIVPSLVNVEQFGKYHKNVQYVPLGIDPVAWAYRPRQKPKRMFRFLADGRGPRKGTDLSRRAFQLAFRDRDLGDGPIPQLILKGNRAAHYADPNTELITSRLSDAAEVELFASCHCYLGPARGEGFGLQPLQAIAQGVPTILTDAHGQAAYAHLGWPLSTTMAKADYFVFGDAGEWWEPNLDELVDHMRWVYDNYDKALETAKGYSEEARATFNWYNTSGGVLDILPDLTEGFTPSEWKEPTHKKYPVVMRVGWNCEIAGRKFHFEPNKVYYERAEVKRILFEGGYLDPACIPTDGEDTGLVPDEEGRVEAMSASHGCCPICGQEFNSKPLYEFPDEGEESGL